MTHLSPFLQNNPSHRLQGGWLQLDPSFSDKSGQLSWYPSVVIFVPPSKNNSIEGGGEHMGSSWGQNSSLKLPKKKKI